RVSIFSNLSKGEAIAACAEETGVAITRGASTLVEGCAWRMSRLSPLLRMPRQHVREARWLFREVVADSLPESQAADYSSGLRCPSLTVSLYPLRRGGTNCDRNRRDRS